MPDAIKVAVVNRSSLAHDDVVSGVAALHEQVAGDFAAAWHVETDVFMCELDQRVGPVWGLVLFNGGAAPDAPDTSFSTRQATIVATSRGLPLAKIDVDTVPHGQDWTHLASHRLLEMLVAPVISQFAYRQVDPDGQGPRFLLHAREICDPCAAYADGYACHGRQVSDFVWPAWFGLPHTGPAHLDERRHLDAPFQVRPGGWAHVFDLASDTWRVLDSQGAATQPGIAPDDRLSNLQGCLRGPRFRTEGLLYPP